jgi:hypothetical protein
VTVRAAKVLEFYPARFSVTDKLLLNGPVHLIFGITDANGIGLFREQLIYRLLLKMWLVLILFSTLHLITHLRFLQVF